MITLKEVARQEPGLTLTAGESGLNTAVSRTHMVETLEIAQSFITAGELIFTTGAGLARPGDQLRLAQAACRGGACGLVLNFGPYIGSVEPGLLSFANQAGFPLFTCPWEVRMAEIMHRISCRIEDDNNAAGPAAALKRAILEPEGWRELQSLGFSPRASFYVAAAADDARFCSDRGHFFSIDGQTIAVFADMDQSQVAGCLRSGCAAAAGPCSSFELGQFYRRALRLLRLHSGESGLFFLEQSGVLQLLLSIDDRRTLERYASVSLGPLLKQDAEKDSRLIQTLETYLHCSGSPADAAARLGVHKNTVTNKLHRCEKLLGLDLNDPAARLELQTALLVRRLLEKL